MRRIGINTIGINSRRGGGILPETQAYIDRMATTPSSSYIRKADARIKLFKDLGIWDSRDLLYFFDMDTLANSLLNVKADAFNGTVVGDVIFEAGVGVKSDGGYIDTGYIPSSSSTNFAQNDACYGYFRNSTSAQWNSNHPCGAFDGSRAIQSLFKYPTTSNGLYLNGIASFTSPTVNNDKYKGWFHIKRSSSATIDIYENERKISGSKVSNGLPTRSIFILADNVNGSPDASKYVDYIGTYHLGSAVSDVNINGLNNSLIFDRDYQYINFEVQTTTEKVIIWRSGTHVISHDTTKIYYSSDSGVTYSSGVAVTDTRGIQFAIRFSNGNIIYATFDNTLYKSTDGLETSASFLPKDASGSDYIVHTPTNALYPGSYFFPPMNIDIIEIGGKEVAFWLPYTNVATGASAVCCWTCIDGGDVVASYEFGQNPAYTDDGSLGGGTGGTALGDAGNAVITRHSHGWGYDSVNDKFWFTTGDNVGEVHWFSCVFDTNDDSFTFTKEHTVESVIDRFKSSNPLFVGNYVYFGSEVTSSSERGLWKALISDIFTKANNERIWDEPYVPVAIRKNGDKFASVALSVDLNWYLLVSNNFTDFNIQELGNYVYQMGDWDADDKINCVEFTYAHSNKRAHSYIIDIK